MKKKLHHSPLFNKRGDARFQRALRHRTRKNTTKTQFKKECVYLSGNFDINHENSRRTLMDDLKKIRSLAANGIYINLSFRKVVAPVDPCGMMLIISEVSKIQEEYPEIRIKYLRPNSDNEESNTILNQLLQKFGLITKEFIADIHEHELVKQWEYICGKEADYNHKEQREFITTIRNRIKDIFTNDPSAISRNLYNSVSEAATNVTNHAYIAPRKIKNELLIKKDDTKWWAFKAELKDSQDSTTGFSVLICDRGIGIPYSLVKKYDNPEERNWREHISNHLQAIGRKISRVRDCDLIETAIKYGKTRTQKEYRGRGLPQIIQTIEQIPKARVRIYSNKGLCEVSSNSDGTSHIDEKKEFNTSILGTIVYWYLPIN